MNANEACAQLRALLVERGRGGGGLVEECVVGDGSVDLEADSRDDRLLAAGGGRHVCMALHSA